ncbi:MAG: hypothetical protein FWE14_09705, partial [Lachnospiraceae bacterium]|nr:hypothetical protein [Lachnospiraceae bacterium]
MKKYLISVLIIITSVIFIACGTAANTSMRESYDMAYMAPATEMYMGAVEMDYINDAIYNEISVDGGGITRA